MPRMPVIDLEWARTLATEWVAAWNSHDLERILAHYAHDVVFSSPLPDRTN